MHQDRSDAKMQFKALRRFFEERQLPQCKECEVVQLRHTCVATSARRRGVGRHRHAQHTHELRNERVRGALRHVGLRVPMPDHLTHMR